jgi:hypothetical protein
MGLPIHNPIDSGWIAKGAPIDHLGSINFHCDACGKESRHEKFLLLAGKFIGVGAPFFAQPFMKRASTKGKAGGTKGHIVQCTQCDSLWSFDESGETVLSMLGLPPAGLPSPTHLAEYERNTARRSSPEPKSPQFDPPTKAKKLD